MAELQIEDPNLPVEIQFEMTGPIFEEGLPIPLTIKSLESVQGIIDRSYLVLSGKKKISASDRGQFYLRSKDIKHSSLHSDLELVFAIAQPVLPFITDLGPKGVWEYAKQAFDFLKFVYEARKNGKTASVKVDGNRNTVSVIVGDQVNTYNGPVFNIALGSLPHYEALAKNLDEDRVTAIRLGEGAKSEIAFSLSDKDLFALPSTIEETIFPLGCEIFEFDKYDHDGRLNVPDGQAIPKGEYKFVVIGNQNLNDHIESMKHSQIIVNCLKEVVDHPLQGYKIVSLQVTGIIKAA
jgi:hypothetical protein